MWDSWSDAMHMVTDCYIILYYKIIILKEILFLPDVSVIWWHLLFFCYNVCVCVYIYVCVSVIWWHLLFFCYNMCVWEYMCVCVYGIYIYIYTHTRACSHHVILKYFFLSSGEKWDLSSASGGTALTCMVIRPGEERHLVQQGQCNGGANIKGRKCEICQLLFINTLGSVNDSRG